ncbi:hypothetical protein HK102_012698, partial [Quaeritorhiza haematococci]
MLVTPLCKPRSFNASTDSSQAARDQKRIPKDATLNMPHTHHLIQFLIICILATLWSTSFTAAERTPQEAAVAARQLVRRTGIGELSTVMAPGSRGGTDGYPFSSVEYYADTCPSTGQPIIALVSWGIHARNLRVDPNVTVSVRDLSWYERPYPSRGVMDRWRVMLMGKLRKVVGGEEVTRARTCFQSQHPDASKWDEAHNFEFWTMTVETVRWIGGFGDEHYVGWLRTEEYLNASPSSTSEVGAAAGV